MDTWRDSVLTELQRRTFVAYNTAAEYLEPARPSTGFLAVNIIVHCADLTL